MSSQQKLNKNINVKSNYNNENIENENIKNENIENENMENININLLTNKINELYDDAFKCIYEIIKRNDEKIITTKNYYLVNLDNVSHKTLKELDDFMNYLDISFNNISNDEQERLKLKMN